MWVYNSSDLANYWLVNDFVTREDPSGDGVVGRFSFDRKAAVQQLERWRAQSAATDGAIPPADGEAALAEALGALAGRSRRPAREGLRPNLSMYSGMSRGRHRGCVQNDHRQGFVIPKGGLHDALYAGVPAPYWRPPLPSPQSPHPTSIPPRSLAVARRRTNGALCLVRECRPKLH